MTGSAKPGPSLRPIALISLRSSGLRWLSWRRAHMKLSRRTVLRLAASVAALPPALSRLACAQAYPTHPITMIVPYPAGGPTDTVGRVVAEHMRKELGQPVILENVTGAAGSIGLGRVARAPADG